MVMVTCSHRRHHHHDVMEILAVMDASVYMSDVGATICRHVSTLTSRLRDSLLSVLVRSQAWQPPTDSSGSSELVSKTFSISHRRGFACQEMAPRLTEHARRS